MQKLVYKLFGIFFFLLFSVILPGGCTNTKHVSELKKFLNHHDSTVLLIGDSIFARTQYNSCLADDTITPPTVLSNNIPAAVWKLLEGNDVHYRRLDNSQWKWNSPTAFVKVANRQDWTASDAYSGLTFISGDQNAVAKIIIPPEYTDFEVIYRSLLNGGLLHIKVECEKTMNIYDINTKQAKGVFTSLYNSRFHGKVCHKHPHVLTLTNKSRSPCQEIAIWGIVYWKGPYIRLINVAKGSHNSEDLFKYLPNELDVFKPDFVIFEYPLLNDVLIKNNPIETSYKYNSRILSLLVQKNVTILTIIPNPDKMVFDDPYVQLYLELVRQATDMSAIYKVQCINIYEKFLQTMSENNLTINDLTADGTHPNDDGVRIYEKELAHILQ